MDTMIFRLCFVIAGICINIFFYKVLLKAAIAPTRIDRTTEIDMATKVTTAFIAFVVNLLFCAFLYHLLKFILTGLV